MKKNKSIPLLLIFFFLFAGMVKAQTSGKASFNKGWKFNLGDVEDVKNENFDDTKWRSLNLPHDWSVELPFDSTSPTGTGGGALRGGIGWYRKVFTLPATAKEKFITISFDGVYRNSEVWINGHFLGKRPNGYISFQYDISPYVNYGNEKNTIAVKVDNAEQPNSRWYSGSGIYRNVWLTMTDKLHVAYNGTYITTPEVSTTSAKVKLELTIDVPSDKKSITASTIIYTTDGRQVAKQLSPLPSKQDTPVIVLQNFTVANPALWSVESPYLYKAVTQLLSNGKVVDEYSTRFGIRSFIFDIDKGFILNGKSIKIRGVCNHHDLGSLGAAINKRALQRQLEILKAMGCNGIRTSHNPPAPELLDLCDEMGFIVMDEAFDMWKREKTKFDYHLDWDKWHVKDFKDQVVRDRNHPSVFIWSLGNEIPEQWAKDEDTSGIATLRELQGLLKSLDATRPTVIANNETNPWNKLMRANITDMIGYNYSHSKWDSVFQHWYRKPFIVTESVSALQTRGHYDMPSDSFRIWPSSWDKPVKDANDDLTCSAYDNCYAPWGSNHEQTLKELEKYPHVSGMFIWTGFDYLGEPTPYPWPARSSYFGIIDLAGFPKDVYYMYQSVWTNKTVLHIFPHWNWPAGKIVDVWAYYNNADEVELFLNEKSLGIRRKMNDELHVLWRVQFKAGTLKAVSRKNGRVVLIKEIKTAGKPAKIILTADKNSIKADGSDLSFITATIVDAAGNMVPYADNLIEFTTKGQGEVIATDNGLQTSMEFFKSNKHKAFNGLCLAIVQSKEMKGSISITASGNGLLPSTIVVATK